MRTELISGARKRQAVRCAKGRLQKIGARLALAACGAWAIRSASPLLLYLAAEALVLGGVACGVLVVIVWVHRQRRREALPIPATVDSVRIARTAGIAAAGLGVFVAVVTVSLGQATWWDLGGILQLVMALLLFPFSAIFGFCRHAMSLRVWDGLRF